MNHSHATTTTRQLSRRVYKQLPRESIIDGETGELRGKPLGSVEIHDKKCPIQQHKHILWIGENQFSPLVATVSFPWQQSHFYLQGVEKRSQRMVELQELSALHLFEKDHAIDEIQESSSQSFLKTKRVQIGDKTLTITDTTCTLLRSLAVAGVQHTEDEQAMHLWCQQVEEERDYAFARQDQLREAKDVVTMLQKQNISVRHPQLPNWENWQFQLKWLRSVTPQLLLQQNLPDVPLLWKQSDTVSLEREHAIFALLQAHSQPLRVLLAEQCFDSLNGKYTERKEYLLQLFGLTTASPLSVHFMHHLLQEEAHHHDRWTRNWEHSYHALENVEPLLIS